jgi:hypothetical protein
VKSIYVEFLVILVLGLEKAESVVIGCDLD